MANGGAASDMRPNLLIIMSDEHAPHFSGAYGHPLVQTPHLDRLVAEGVLFEQAYCNTPLCVPSRMSFMTGRFVHNTGAWDNASPLASDAVTWAHRLRAAGYDVVLAGKQHFVGPDKLHGFRAQLARDLHAEQSHPIFDWTDGTPPAPVPWPVLAKAGPGTTTEIEVDDEVEAAALAYLRDPARREQPWALNVSFLAPHFPLIVPQPFWDLYPPDRIDLPDVPPGHLDNQHPVYQRMRQMFGFEAFPEELVRRGRAGYYGLITYLDEKIGHLLDTLAATGQDRNTLVVYTSDHGEMAGEHGMWRKSNFYEHSARVPLVLRWPGMLPAGRRDRGVVSLVDLVATIVDAAVASSDDRLDGDSLLPLARGETADWKDEAFAEYLGHGVARPMAMLRRDRFKLNYSLGDPPELYDLDDDPGELHDLATDSAHRDVVEVLTARLLERWDPVALERRVRQSQRDRLLIHAATTGEDAADGRRRWAEAGASLGGPTA
ncbi:MAG: sulfatase-like hydrolase/transferase [Chloroflexia bacterium]|nr:sulfatase-like hydrolase/transferase [Chloroflexia bacterium]